MNLIFLYIIYIKTYALSVTELPLQLLYKPRLPSSSPYLLNVAL